MDIESLGFTKDELQERVVQRLCEQLLTGVGFDEDREEFTTASQFQRQMQARIKDKIESTINTIAEREVLPNVSAYIESMTLQETTRWGERIGQPVTFTEYLVQRAEAYMQEKVDYQGKSKPECGGYTFNGTQTRITYMVNQHLHYSIEEAMKGALAIATSAVATGLQETVKLKLEEVSKGLKVAVSTK